MAKAKEVKAQDEKDVDFRKHVEISAPNFQVAEFYIRGDAPYVQNKFSSKARQQIKDTQMAGSVGKKGKKREPKNFQECYEGALYKVRGGGYGIPASGFRCAMVSACKVVGFQMTRAKLGIFVIADCYDDEGTPLVRITKGEPKYREDCVRPEKGGTDIRARPMWEPGWEAKVRVRFDADMFSLQDIANLMMRVGVQVGQGEGRPDSKKSCGMGWGTFEIVN